MPPRIETVTDLSAEIQGAEAKYFVINLQKEVEVFDLDLFYSQVREVSGIPVNYQGLELVKYVVVADRMFLFADYINHVDFYDSLKISGINDELQSAGELTIDFARSRLGLKSRCSIGSYSASFAKANALSREKSDEYKLTIIKQALGGLFQVY